MSVVNVQLWCKAYYFVQAMSYTASVCILTVISIERFVAIIYPMHSRRLHSMSLLRATIIGVWTVAAASGLPFIYVYDTLDILSDGSLPFCMRVQVHWFNIRAYTCATFILWYALPLTLMALVYARISVVLWHSSHGPRVISIRQSPAAPSTVAVHHDASVSTSDVASPVKCVVESADSPADSTDQDDAPDTLPTSSGAGGKLRLLRHLGFYRRQSVRRQDHLSSPHCLITVEPSSDDARHDAAVELRSLTSGHETHHHVCAMTANADQTALSARRKVIRLLIAVVISFAVCVLPYHVRLLWQTFSELQQLTDWHLLITPITFVFYYLNSGLNPLLYAFLSNKFRSSLKDVLHGRRGATTQMAIVTYDAGGHVSMNTRTVRTASVS